MTLKKKQKGFTLVEVIVVAVIVAVLAAVAIPLYNGYIRDSRTNVCQNTAASVASAFTAAIQQGRTANDCAGYVSGQTVTIPALSEGAPPNIITIPAGYTLTVSASGGTVTVTGPGNSTSTAVQFTNT